MFVDVEEVAVAAPDLAEDLGPLLGGHAVDIRPAVATVFFESLPAGVGVVELNCAVLATSTFAPSCESV